MVKYISVVKLKTEFCVCSVKCLGLCAKRRDKQVSENDDDDGTHNSMVSACVSIIVKHFNMASINYL